MKKWIICLIGCALSVGVMAQIRSVEDAKGLAMDFFRQSLVRKNSPATQQTFQLVQQRYAGEVQTPAMYIFQRGEKDGFVVISGDERAQDVLCYSENGVFDRTNPHLEWWLNRYAEQIASASAEQVNHTSTASVTPIAPLLGSIAWDQKAPYNNYCPVDCWTSQRSLTGCVATAAAQIMRYWCWPACGTGTTHYVWYDCKDYNCTEYQTYNVNMQFDTVPFDWANMPEVYTESATDVQKNAVATLMLMAGIACKMQYASDPVGSAAWTDDMGYGLQTYFGYQFDKCISEYADSMAYVADKGAPAADIQMEYNVSESAFTAAFNQSLEAGRPILMGGAGSAGGHEFVCDGRDANGLYHINWGWSGDSNCYCALNALSPDGKRVFSNGVDALVGVRPQSATDLREVALENVIRKYIYNNQVVIERDGKLYTTLGQLIPNE